MHTAPRFLVAVLVLSLLTAAPAATAQTETVRGLDLLVPYVDVWVGQEARETPDGRAYRFEYELEWFDSQQTILEMTISQVYDDGGRDQIWTGFKGWDAVGKETYYHGFSVGGRMGRGVVVAADGDYAVDTIYEGIAATGAVRIRDRFTPIRDDGFTSVTEMEREGAWVEINRDSWRRRQPMTAANQETTAVDLSAFDDADDWRLITPADVNFSERIGLQRSFFAFELDPPNMDPYTTELVLDVFPGYYGTDEAYIIQWTTSGHPKVGAGAIDSLWVDAATFQVRHRVAQTGPPDASGGAGLYSVMRYTDETAMRVHVPPQGEVETFRRDSPLNVFDFASMGYLFGMMDLKEGDRFRLANVGIPPDLDPMLVPVRVGGMVEIAGDDGVSLPAREVVLTAADRSTMITFWISDEAPYFLGWRFVLTGSGDVLNVARYRSHQL